MKLASVRGDLSAVGLMNALDDITDSLGLQGGSTEYIEKLNWNPRAIGNKLLKLAEKRTIKKRAGK